ncbi:uncharacterized protein LOC117522098 [Thalassophryne amazonica]|uniref:uncharacterized protein LOC117522098 n=1 Tax=Thalassophryne amazonica TaxID=390379 RepID=UPI00147129F1|nr:uncharacterized protein LOC117522098 [Thalassophryne amazonica]
MRSRRNKRVAGGSDAVVQNRSRKRRKMIGKDKEWCLFCFNVGERSLYSVPKSWVSSFKNLKKPLGGGRYKLFYKCWWPKEDSSEATASKMKMLVRNCSEPDFDQWTQRRGKPLGTFLELEKCEAALAKREGLSTSESENNGEESAEISPPGRAQARSQDDVADQDNETAGLSSAKRPAPQLTAHRRLASVFAADAQLSKIPRVELTPTEGRGSIMQMLGILMACLIDSSLTPLYYTIIKGGCGGLALMRC